LNIHSFLGLLTRATTDAWHPELLLGEQGDHEVVLVVAGDRGDDIGVGGLDCLERGHLTCVAEEPLHRSVGSEAVEDRGCLIDERDHVSGGLQLIGHVSADAARTGDDHVHR
jgi:hypothetical protein